MSMTDDAEASTRATATSPSNSERLLRSVEDAMIDLDYGSILITVHAAKVVQLEVTRKRRFPD